MQLIVCPKCAWSGNPNESVHYVSQPPGDDSLRCPNCEGVLGSVMNVIREEPQAVLHDKISAIATEVWRTQGLRLDYLSIEWQGHEFLNGERHFDIHCMKITSTSFPKGSKP